MQTFYPYPTDEMNSFFNWKRDNTQLVTNTTTLWQYIYVNCIMDLCNPLLPGTHIQ